MMLSIRSLIHLGGPTPLLVLAPLVAGQDLLKTIQPSDGHKWSEFGVSVAVDGDYALIGAVGDDHGGLGLYTGAAYLYDLRDGSELLKLTGDDSMRADSFGRAVALQGDYALIGAADNDSLGDLSGAAYVFDTRTGEQLYKLMPSDPKLGERAHLGAAVAIDGRYAVVGAPGYNEPGGHAGAAYVFDLEDGSELRRLRPSEVAPGDYFGGEIAVSGDLAIISSAGRSEDSNWTGAAYVFDLTTGSELFKLTLAEAVESSHFGISLDADGDRVVIGAHTTANSSKGAAYLYDLKDGSLLQVLKPVTSSDDSFLFAREVKLAGDLVAVGFPGYSDPGYEWGAVQMFSAHTGQFLGEIVPEGGAPETLFGEAFDLSAELAVIGQNAVHTPFLYTGAAYVYDLGYLVPEPAAGVALLIPCWLWLLLKRRP